MRTFGEAIEALKDGKSVARSGWNGKGMFLSLRKGMDSTSFVNKPDKDGNVVIEYVEGIQGKLFEVGDESIRTRLPNIRMITATGSIVEGWLASQTDMLAEDWEILN